MSDWFNSLFGLSPKKPKLYLDRTEEILEELNKPLMEKIFSSTPPNFDFIKEVVEPLVKEAEPAFLAKNDEELAAFNQELSDQKNGFHYEFVRRGDFLTIHLERRANRAIDFVDFNNDLSEEREVDRIYREKHERQFVTTINLTRLNQIKLVPGHATDKNGTVEWKCVVVTPSGGEQSIYYFNVPDKPFDEGLEYRVYPQFYGYRGSRSRFLFDRITDKENRPKDVAMRMSYSGRYVAFPTTGGIARQYKDDELILNGCNLILTAPFGMGEAMQEALLTAIETGYEPKDHSIQVKKDRSGDMNG